MQAFLKLSLKKLLKPNIKHYVCVLIITKTLIMAKIKMNKEVHKVLRKKIIAFKKLHGMTWKDMQRCSIKKLYEVPCEWQTLFNIFKGVSAHPNTTKKLLDYFEVESKKEHSNVTLVKTEENEDSNNN